jgi:hypothetical protein
MLSLPHCADEIDTYSIGPVFSSKIVEHIMYVLSVDLVWDPISHYDGMLLVSPQLLLMKAGGALGQNSFFAFF